MVSQVLAQRVTAILHRKAQTRWFPALVGGCAFVATITLSLPVELLVVVSVLLRPARWTVLSLAAAAGSAAGDAVLYFAFHHLGWQLLIDWYPDMATSRLWADMTRWLSSYGAAALFVVMAVPMPVAKTPALAFVAIYRMPIAEVVLAIGAAKLLKFAVYGYVVSRFPGRFRRWYAPLPRAHSSAAVATGFARG
jgi:membrane protein YqaA with SNARE-associated domain